MKNRTLSVIMTIMLIASMFGFAMPASPAAADYGNLQWQPTSQTVNAGQTASFSALASGYPTPTVQWQVSTDGSSWSDVTGGTSTTLTLSNVQTSQSGYKYHAVFTNAAGTATSNPATLTVNTAPAVTSQPPTTSGGRSMPDPSTFAMVGSGLAVALLYIVLSRLRRRLGRRS